MPETPQENEYWLPQDVERALGRDKFPVIHYGDDASEQDVIDACLSCRQVGLSHIKLGSAKAILLCLTTDEKIVVLDMQLPSHVEMFKILLTIPSIKFYTIKGPYLVYNLQVEFGIDLKPAIDLTVYDMLLSMRKASLNKVLHNSLYSMERMAESRDDVMYRNRTDMAKYWLNVDLPPKDLEKESAETQLIRSDPKSFLAANIIRKRSCLIRVLGKKMQEKLFEITYQDTQNLYEFAHRVKDEAYVEYENLKDESYPTMISVLKQHGCDGR